MKLKYLLITCFFMVVKTYSQNTQKVLFSINNEPVYSQEFLDIYKKNLNLIPDSESNSIESYLKLYVDFKLKVKEAKDLGLDTVSKFKNELNQYKNNLVLPYLKDEELTIKLVEEAYERLNKEVNVSHILLFLKPESSSADTLKTYNRLLEARNFILKGDNFSEIAKKYSEDPSVLQNGGEIGYFTAFQMVYPFENVAFTTKVNEVSMPFKTKFGYHILKVNDIRNSKGEVEVAHIMLKNDNVNTKQRIDSIYEVLKNGNINFFELAQKISEDKASAVKGGRLEKFGTGKMVEDFANVAFEMQLEGDISKPFKTQFGWHIIKLMKKYPIESYFDIQEKLIEQVKKDERSNLIGKSVIDKLFAQYKIVVNENALEQFETENWKKYPLKFQGEILSIEDYKISQKDFMNFLNNSKPLSIKKAFYKFKENEVLDYYKKNIQKTNPEFAATFKDFKEGLMLFDLLEKRVWNKANDSIGISNFYETYKIEKYNNKDFESIKGNVISDYQKYLEESWVIELYKKYTVSFNEHEKKKILKLKL